MRFLIALMLMTGTAQANDKAMHFTTSALATTFSGVLYREAGEIPKEQAIILGVVSSFLLGVAKEVADEKFDGRDMLANSLGNGVGVLVLQVSL